MPDGSITPEGEIAKKDIRFAKLKAGATKLRNLVSQRTKNTSTPTSTSFASDAAIPLPPPPETLTFPPEFNIDTTAEQEMPPLFTELPENPANVLDYLKRRNPEYAYDDTFTPEQMAHAIAFSKSKGWNPEELSPAQIELAQIYEIGDKTPAELAEETTEKRIERLTNSKDFLREILLPEKTTFFHATPVRENVDSIYNSGLYCHVNTGLGGVAAPLERKSHIENNLLDEQVIANNLKILANPHRGYPYEVIIELPELTAEQKADYDTRKRNGDDINLTSYFITPLSEPVGIPGVQITYNAILPSKYIKGYLDTTTGIFHPKPKTLNQ